ncbi:MAG: hypothetical protein Q9160_001835 [Pyrenula sp. 1 TL-2023]
MASAAQCLRRSLIQCHRTIPLKRKWQIPATFPHRQFTTTPCQFQDNNKATPNPSQVQDIESHANRFVNEADPDDAYQDARAHFKSLTPAEQQQLQDEWAQMGAEMDEEVEREVEEAMPQTTPTPRERELEDALSFPIAKTRSKDLGFWGDDEEFDEDAMVEDMDDEFKDDDVTSMAHAELELHREIREYTRIAAWEMPFLNTLSKPYEKPNRKSLPLRFRYTTYMGESHPAQKKVAVDFSLSDLRLSPSARIKLTKLLGPRYNPRTESAKLSCEKFENPAQNKRYLGDLVNNLVKEAETGEDTMEDIPLDLRHAKKKLRNAFPEAWKLSSDKKMGDAGKVENLLKNRAERKLLEDTRVLVDGEAEIKMQHVYAMREGASLR